MVEAVEHGGKANEAVKGDLRGLVPTRGLFGTAFIVPLFAIRMACVVAAGTSGLAATVSSAGALPNNTAKLCSEAARCYCSLVA